MYNLLSRNGDPFFLFEKLQQSFENMHEMTSIYVLRVQEISER